jgi:hypothetical protein
VDGGVERRHGAGDGSGYDMGSVRHRRVVMVRQLAGHGDEIIGEERRS